MRSIIHAALGLLGLAVAVATLSPADAASTPRKPPTPTPEAERRAAIGAVKSWGIQLRIRNLAGVAGSPFDLVVIDHGFWAGPEGKKLFTPEDVAALKTRTDGTRRLVLAYFSIGEAEQYRFYWDKSWADPALRPSWILAENTNWPGNFPVRFWDPAWQRIILGSPDAYLERLIAQGFDGVYLDRSDVYEELKPERPTAARDMVQFIKRIGSTARAIDPRFLIVMQNAEELLVHADLRRAIDAASKEDLLYGLDFGETANPKESSDAAIKALGPMRREKRPVFAIEYVDDPETIAAARKRHAALGHLVYFAPRNLEELVVDPIARGRHAVRRPTAEPIPPVAAPVVPR